MADRYRKSLYIFRRDLRLHDNSALNAAAGCSEQIIPYFIFDPRQVEAHLFRSKPAFGFMLESLHELNAELMKSGAGLSLAYGRAEEVVDRLLREEHYEALFLNRDYTPFSLERDKKIEEVCLKRGVVFRPSHDLLLHEPDSSLKSDGSPYTVFTPFFKKVSQLDVRKTEKLSGEVRFAKGHTSLTWEEVRNCGVGDVHSGSLFAGGRSHALEILRGLSRLRDYQQARDIPSIEGTTRLSAHNKFGTCSIREVYAAVLREFGSEHPLLRQLYWRDFFTLIGLHFPHVFGKPFHERYDSIEWPNDERWFRAWCEGRTGFPIVDAGMRQLNQTGWMHNRVRMIVASFLVKDLQIDWRWGERYFATRLMDYDPAVNNGSWQWAASTGCDAQPFFRVFNPWNQQKKFDPDCLYIKQWVPELGALQPKEIHRLEHGEGDVRSGYPVPIVDHAEMRQRAIRLFDEARG